MADNPMTAFGTRRKVSAVQRLRQLLGVHLPRVRCCQTGRSWPNSELDCAPQSTMLIRWSRSIWSIPLCARRSILPGAR